MRKFQQLSYEEVDALFRGLIKIPAGSINTTDYIIIDIIADELKEELELRG